MLKYSELLLAAYNEVWAMHMPSLQTYMHTASVDMAAKKVKLPRVQGDVAIIPIHGVISQRSSIWEDFFGGTSTMRFDAAFARAYNDSRVGAIVLDVDSPGGTTSGVQMSAERVFEMRGKGKPIVAVANSMACSAAYWIGSAAEHLFAAPGATVGSIGVYRMHADFSKMLEDEGIKMTFMAMPEYKVECNPYEPMNDDAREHQMDQVKETYEIFNKAVASHRGVSPAKAREGFGKGRDFHAIQARDMGMVDDMRPIEDVIREMMRGKPKMDEQQALQQDLIAAWELGDPEQCVTQPKTSGEVVKRRKTLLEKRMA